MWFRFFAASWSVVLFLLLGWMSTHQSSEPNILGRYSSGYFTLLVGIAALATVSLLAHYPPFYRRLHRMRWRIILSLISFLVPLLIVELAIRLIDPFGLSHFRETCEIPFG